MFLDKYSRFFRLYMLTLRPRKTQASYLPLKDAAPLPSIEDALRRHLEAEKALEVQPNGDIVELMQVEYRDNALVLLFHRASPDAADPIYRKKALAAAGRRVTLRQSERREGEEQSVSAHLVVFDEPVKQGVYRTALEEIPGLNMTVVRRIIALALSAYTYESQKGKKVIETYTVMRADGIKSESLTEALRNGSLNYVTLSRPAPAHFVDEDFQPTTETLRLRIKGEITSENWKTKFGNLVEAGKKEGYDTFTVDLNLDDSRKRTVSIEREKEAEEILFVRSEFAAFKTELKPCTEVVHDEIVATALRLAKAAK